MQHPPHPSIFYNSPENNLAQIRSKIPVVSEVIDYTGHDLKYTVPKDRPLVGCKLKMIDYEHVDKKIVEGWTNAIKAAGGKIEQDISSITHLICENRLSADYNMALSRGVRCITIYWINDVLAQDRMTFPWKALHLPTPFAQKSRPLSNQMITITNFKGRYRREVKEMIMKTGACYTEHFSRSNTLVICGHVGGDKYEKAIEWKVPIANSQLLSDIILGINTDLNTMLLQSKYQIFKSADTLKLTSYKAVLDLMIPWKKAITTSDSEESLKLDLGAIDNKPSAVAFNPNDDSGIATSGSNNSDADACETLPNLNDVKVNGNCDSVSGGTVDINISSAKQSASQDQKILRENNETKPDYLCSDNPEAEIIRKCIDSIIKRPDIAAEEVVVNGREEIEKVHRKSSDPVSVIFTGLDSNLVEKLESYAIELGATIATSPASCTHLIVDAISRTPKFICAFSNAQYILTYKWLIDSHEERNLLDERTYILQDKEGEETYSFNLAYSLYKRKKRQGLLFTNMRFFVTPGVIRAVPKIKEMIESAGGLVATRRFPSRMQVSKLNSEGKRFVVITCRKDLYLCAGLETYTPDIVDYEFVISGILRQDIDFDTHRLDCNNRPRPIPQTNLTNKSTKLDTPEEPSPKKKVKLDEVSGSS